MTGVQTTVAESPDEGRNLSAEEHYRRAVEAEAKVLLPAGMEIRDPVKRCKQETKERYKRTAEMAGIQSGWVKKEVVDFLGGLGIEVTTEGKIIGRVRKDLQKNIYSLDAEIRRKENERESFSESVDDLREARNGALQVINELESGIEKITVERDELLKKYRAGGEYKPTSREVRRKDALGREMQRDLDRYNSAVLQYDSEIREAEAIAQGLDYQITDLDDARGQLYDRLADNVAPLHLSQDRSKLTQLGLGARRTAEKLEKLVGISESGSSSEPVSIGDIVRGKGRKGNRENYHGQRIEALRKAQTEKVMARKAARNERVKEIAGEVKKDPFY